MARPREFEIDTAVEQAMEVFWRRGYEATSVEDLTSALGIGKGSMYAAFGSKQQLYTRALDMYCERQAVGLVERLGRADDVRGAVRGVLIDMAETDLLDPERGCFLVNATTERSDDPAVAARAAAAMRLVESAFADALTRARAQGQLDPGKDPASMARLLTTVIQGLRVMGKARAGRRFVEDTVDAAVGALD